MSASGPVECDLWRVDLDVVRDLRAITATLSDDERARCARFVFERDRRRFAAARHALRAVLAERVGAAPADLEFRYGHLGKPVLAPWCRAGDLRFNLSHSRGLALVAVIRGFDVGVDVEAIDPSRDIRSLVTREFSARERIAFDALPADARDEAFFRAWVRKEAFLKATGEGLYAPLASVEVTFGAHEPPRLFAIRGDASAAGRWSLISLGPASGYAGALVVADPGPIRVALRHFEWNPLRSRATAVPR